MRGPVHLRDQTAERVGDLRRRWPPEPVRRCCRRATSGGSRRRPRRRTNSSMFSWPMPANQSRCAGPSRCDAGQAGGGLAPLRQQRGAGQRPRPAPGPAEGHEVVGADRVEDRRAVGHVVRERAGYLRAASTRRTRVASRSPRARPAGPPPARAAGTAPRPTASPSGRAATAPVLGSADEDLEVPSLRRAGGQGRGGGARSWASTLAVVRRRSTGVDRRSPSGRPTGGDLATAIVLG